MYPYNAPYPVGLLDTLESSAAGSLFGLDPLAKSITPPADSPSCWLDHSDTYDAFIQVIEEYHTAMQEMNALQWEQVGEELEENGQKRALYRMKNPNCKIAAMLTR